MPGVFDPKVQLCRAAEVLATRYSGVFSPETVEQYLLNCHEDPSVTARIHTRR